LKQAKKKTKEEKTYLSRPGPLYPRVPSSAGGFASSLAGAAGASSVIAGSVAAGTSVVASVVSTGAASAAGASTGASGAATGSSTGFVTSDMLMVVQRGLFGWTKVFADGMEMEMEEWKSPVVFKRWDGMGEKAGWRPAGVFIAS
jgi:hypothetical protein